MAEARAPGAVPAPKQLAGFLARFTPETAAFARAARTRLRKQIPGGIEFVYDNYNALVMGYGPTERPSDAVLSLAVFPRWVTLCFLKGTTLPDPKKLLKGGGNVVRHIRLEAASDLGKRDIARLITLAIAFAAPPYARGRVVTVIRSISARQRPRQP